MAQKWNTATKEILWQQQRDHSTIIISKTTKIKWQYQQTTLPQQWHKTTFMPIKGCQLEWGQQHFTTFNFLKLLSLKNIVYINFLRI